MSLHQASLQAGGHFQVPSISAYDFGAGDFSIVAMITTRTAGVVISRLEGAKGFAIWIDARGRFVAWIGDGTSDYQLTSAPTGALSGGCHTVAAVRTAGVLLLYLDGVQVPAQVSGTGPASLDVSVPAPILLGAASSRVPPVTQLIGELMNVGVWSVALTADQVVEAMFCRFSGSPSGLQGYWSLDGAGTDLSSHHNTAVAAGSVTFVPCIDCMWAEGSNQYYFCQMENVPVGAARVAGDPTLMMTRHIPVGRGARSLYACIMADSDAPRFPTGAVVTITDPRGQTYGASVNTGALFVAIADGQPWAFMAIDPMEGHWIFEVSAPASLSFSFQVQLVPTASVVTTITGALTPLYGDPQARVLAALPGGFLSGLVKVAVAGLAGVAIAGLVIASGGAALPAVVAGLAAFTAVGVAETALSLPEIGSDSIAVAQEHVAGMAGFVVAAERVLLIDANVEADRATMLIYKRRSKKLYPAVTASVFNRNSQRLIEADDTRNNVRTALLGFDSGYVTASGHGVFYALTGWFEGPDHGALQEVLTTLGAQRFTAPEVTGKIFHLFACSCGSIETDSGLGMNLIASGGIAFFGYNQPFAMPVREYPTFCDCDIQIDLALLEGETCDVAYTRSSALYRRSINTYIASGDTQAAALLEGNLNALVCPSTNAVFGNRDARLALPGPVARSRCA